MVSSCPSSFDAPPPASPSPLRLASSRFDPLRTPTSSLCPSRVPHRFSCTLCFSSSTVRHALSLLVPLPPSPRPLYPTTPVAGARLVLGPLSICISHSAPCTLRSVPPLPLSSFSTSDGRSSARSFSSLDPTHPFALERNGLEAVSRSHTDRHQPPLLPSSFNGLSGPILPVSFRYSAGHAAHPLPLYILSFPPALRVATPAAPTHTAAPPVTADACASHMHLHACNPPRFAISHRQINLTDAYVRGGDRAEKSMGAGGRESERRKEGRGRKREKRSRCMRCVESVAFPCMHPRWLALLSSRSLQPPLSFALFFFCSALHFYFDKGPGG